MNSLALALISSIVFGAAASAAAQDVLDRAKVQYESASYEDALSTLSEAPTAVSADKVQVEQYRALCLIALGRLPEAEHAISTLVAADPTYMPSSSVASPKVLGIVADIRKKELPGIIRSLLERGRQSYQRKELADATEMFEMVLRLVDDPSMTGRPEVEDMKVLARGFVDLAAAASAPPPTQTAANMSVPPPTPSPTSSPRAPAPATFVPAVAIQQTMPVWEPPSRAFATTEYTGSIRVHIGADGKVKTVTIERPSHPAYDSRLLQVAQTWLYKPATRDGEPVESEKVIAVRLQPIY